ncbi:putative poly(A) polymerase large subunit [Diachasmimorpha longicaudata entomopoxvirus]|uniref:Poly(A) polymerase catalytic subunit n=1 Tax=Diachasmimorpha longicaudata entomopoxvirus TaxID=109981 RepID=A0A7R5WM71_9POXV|nr:putative poly(A) polymerase large subunit [Diachasmimorpha longicaudata entomopoxvirus]AKS26419.1 putative poly(A) polymerase large subunit [Diachasmimorpha longicaudata entomopoxvirus]
MSSKKIIPTVFVENPTELSNSLHPVFTEYLGTNLKNVVFDQNNIKLFKRTKTIEKAQFCTNILKNPKILKFKERQLIGFFKKYIQNEQEALHQINPKMNIIENINNNFGDFKKKQKTLTCPYKILSLLEFQYTFFKYSDDYIFKIANASDLADELSVVPMAESPDIKAFVTKFFSKYNISLRKRPHPHAEQLSELDQVIFRLLKGISEELLIQTQKSTLHAESIIFYGSYTSFVLNDQITYNDLDVYHINPMLLLKNLAIIFKLILDIDVDILMIPFILGHASLGYKNKHFLDVIYIDPTTMHKIPIKNIRGFEFVSPIIQMLNNFRMMSELRRVENISNISNMIEKFTTLLTYTNTFYQIPYADLPNKSSISGIKHKIIDGTIVLIDIKDWTNGESEYDWLMVPLLSIPDTLNFLNIANIQIFRQFFALFSEIVAQVMNRPKAGKSSNMKDKKKLLSIEVSKIPEMPRTSLTPEGIAYVENILNTSNVLIMSKFSVSIYLINQLNPQQVLVGQTLTNMSIETLLSSFVLHHFLHKHPNSLNYFKKLLSVLNSLEKQEEWEILSKYKSGEKMDYSQQINKTIIKKNREKLKGKHIRISYSDLENKNVFFYQTQTKELYTYDEFLDLTAFNYQ